MHQMSRSRNLIILLILISVLAVACTGGGTADEPSSPPQASQGETTSSEESVTAEDAAATEETTDTGDSEDSDETAVSDESESDDDSTVDAADTDEAVDEDASQDDASEDADTDADETAPSTGPVGELNLSWDLVNLGEGIKPALDIDSAGNAHIAFLTEKEMGALFYANNTSGDFEDESVAQGYFYGPVDIAVGTDDLPRIAYHDHQGTSFDPNLGDEVVAVKGEGGWELVTVSDMGHDGWDNSIAIDADGNWHTASVDPSQFGSSAGVEYATNASGEVVVSQIGSGPIAYEFATSIKLGPDGLPGITYYDDVAEVLKYAKFDGSEWAIETVDDNGDAGRYASLIYDQSGNPHIAYFVFDGERTGVVRHAWWDGSTWQLEDVDRLDDVLQGHVGARKITSITVDGEDNLHIAYSDRGRVVYGQRGEDGWSVQEVPKNSDKFLGQLVELEIDADGNPHMTWFEVTVFSPTLIGDIIYASGS